MILPLLLAILATAPGSVTVVVTDGVTGVGLPEASVQWQVMGAQASRTRMNEGFGPGEVRTTGANGQVGFAAPVEESWASITVRHPGYVQETPPLYYPLVGGSKGLTRIEIRMWPELSITGRLLDSRTENPLVGVEVVAKHMNLVIRQVHWDFETPSVSSDEKGRFRIGKLPPGKYLLTILPKENSRKLSRGLPKKDEIDNVPVPDGYPGFNFPESGLLSVETDTDLGTIPVRRQPLPSVFGSVVSAGNLDGRNCEPRLLPAHSFIEDPRLTLGSTLPCSGGFRIDNVPSGSYVLEMIVRDFDLGSTGLYKQMVQVPESQPFRYDSRTRVTIVASNARQEAVVRLVLNGQPADRLPEDLLKELKIFVIPRNMSGLYVPVTKIEKTGEVRLPVVLNTPHSVSIDTSARYVLSGVKYNGAEVKDRIHLLLDPAAAQHSIVLNLSSHPASITGQIERRGVKGPVGCLLLTGLPAENDNPSEDQVVEADSEGRVSFERLAAGDYRIVAAPLKLLRSLGDPEVFARLAANARHVALRDGEQLRVELEIR